MIMRTIFASLLFVAVAGCGDDAPSEAPNGEACEVADDCQSGECWLELVSYHPFGGPSVYTLDDGMCSVECSWPSSGTPEEVAQGSCEDGEYCLVYGASASICFQACSDEILCREDYVCTALSDGFTATCLPPTDN